MLRKNVQGPSQATMIAIWPRSSQGTSLTLLYAPPENGGRGGAKNANATPENSSAIAGGGP